MSRSYLHNILPVTAICLLQGCISDDLNLSHAKEFAVSIGDEGVTLPGVSSFDVPLSQLIEVSEESELMIDSITGDFLFYKKGDDMDSTVIRIGQGSICDGTDCYSTICLTSDSSVVLTPNKRFPDFGSLSFENTFFPSFPGDALKDGILDISYVETTLTIDFDYAFENVTGFDYLDQVEYVVPSFYDLVDESELIETNVPVNAGTHSHSIHVKGVRFDNKDLRDGDVAWVNPIYRCFELHGAFKIKGNVKSVNIAEYQSSNVPTLQSRLIVGTLGTDRVTGRFNQVELIDFPPMEFHDLPDFIQDEEVEIDVENPICRLSLKSEVPVNVTMNAEIIGIKDGAEISRVSVGRDYGTEEILFEGADEGEMKTTNIWLSRIPVDVPDSVEKNIVIPEIANIMRRIPDQFNFNLSASTDSTQQVTLSLSDEYCAIPTYELIVPLKMGPNMKIVYSKELEGMGEKLSHLDFTSLLVTANVINNLPLDIEIKAVAYDIDGAELGDVQIVTPASIPAYQTSNIELSLTDTTEGATLKKIETVSLKIYATSSEKLAGVTLNRNQNLRMEEVRVSIY